MQVVVECAKMILRLGLSDTLAAQISTIRKLIDEALVAHQSQCKSNDIGGREWYNLMRQEASLVLDCSLVDSVYASPDWSTMGKEIAGLCKASSLGHRLFNSWRIKLGGERMSSFMRSLLKGANVLAPDMYKKTLEKVRAQATSIGAPEFVEKREILVNYRGIDVACTVRGWMEEFLLRWSAAVKNRCAGTKHLADLPYIYEADLFPEAAAAVPDNVADELLCDFRKARSSVQKMLDTLPMEADVVMPMLHRRLGMLLTLDSSFVLEVRAAKAMAEQQGIEAVERLVMEALPRVAYSHSLQESVMTLERLRQHAVYKWGGRSIRSRVDSTHEILSKMMAASAPPLSVIWLELKGSPSSPSKAVSLNK